MPTETMPKEALTPEELRRQKEREYFKKYYQKNKEKIKKHDKEYKRKRYHSDPEFREKYLEAGRRRHLEYHEAYKRLKITLGGKCSVCGEDDLDVLEIHHPDGKEGRSISFIHSKEFRKWVRHGIKPNIVLLCANHH